MIKHNNNPTNVGKMNAITLHLMLPVSFLTVKSDVIHGQWKREKSIVFSAVSVVQPLSINNCLKILKSDMLFKADVPIYAIITIGITISLAGSAKINAKSMTPSSPIRAANGSKNEATMLKIDVPPMHMFANKNIIKPAGIADTTARPSTKSVLSKIERVNVLIISGLR